MAKSKKNRGYAGWLFMPAGTFIGLGIGFLTTHILAALFIGMGCGFAAFAITLLSKKK